MGEQETPGRCSCRCGGSGWQRPESRAASPHPARSCPLDLERVVSTRNHTCLNTHITPLRGCPVRLGVLEGFCYFCIVCSHSCFSIPSTSLPHSPSSLRGWWYSSVVTPSVHGNSLICWCSWIVYWMWRKASCNTIVPILQWHSLFWQGCISVCPRHTISNSYFLSSDFSDA